MIKALKNLHLVAENDGCSNFKSHQMITSSSRKWIRLGWCSMCCYCGLCIHWLSLKWRDVAGAAMASLDSSEDVSTSAYPPELVLLTMPIYRRMTNNKSTGMTIFYFPLIASK